MDRVSKLTARQKAFLDKLFELYQEHKGPVHYSAVAERLGVNRFSAYDMLRVLESKGFAYSSYALATGHSGPGRSMVVFAPTSRAASALTVDAEPLAVGEEWQSVRERVLRRLREARGANHREALNELMARLPEARVPLVFCTEMIGVFLLNMRRAAARRGSLNPFRVLRTLRGSGDAELATLAGLSVGTTLADPDESSPSLSQRLLEHAESYQAHLARLSEEARSALIQFLEEALEALD